MEELSQEVLEGMHSPSRKDSLNPEVRVLEERLTWSPGWNSSTFSTHPGLSPFSVELAPCKTIVNIICWQRRSQGTIAGAHSEWRMVRDTNTHRIVSSSLWVRMALLTVHSTTQQTNGQWLESLLRLVWPGFGVDPNTIFCKATEP